jgi:hypothetical protein
VNKALFKVLAVSLCFWFEGPFAEPAIPADPYAILMDIPSLYALFSQKGLAAYSADVAVEGAITASLLEITSQKDLPPPSFIEYYTPKRGFAFRLKNSSYPPLLRQVVSEMFTPVQAFDRVIALMESKRELGWLEYFRSVTTVEAKWVQYEQSPHIKLVFTSLPAAPIEKKEENGKAWTTLAMTFIVAPSSKLIKLLKVDQLETLGTGEARLEKKFYFTYEKIGTHWMPSGLMIEKNGAEEIHFQATYSTIDKFIVYKEKRFCYLGASGHPDTVRMLYDNYRFNKTVDFSWLEEEHFPLSSRADETKAEELYNHARDCIVEGKPKEAKTLLRKIIKEYAGTSYMEHAKTLLDGLVE